ncbi:MAG: excinuclease ABC subunit UvrC [Rhodocyclaceae bacterium]
MIEDAAALVASLPEAPGVYRMLGAAGELLYVGKAKDLRRRVASYFRGRGLSPRIALMVRQVARLETTVTRSEAEALLLENNLIKALHPRYNIVFRDDKSYPCILVTAGRFPRIAFHRGPAPAGARAYGPFPGAAAVRESLQLLQKVFRLRSCEDSVFRNRSRPCLLHQIGRCSAPCVGLIDEHGYAADLHMAEWFLQGRHGEVIERLGARMNEAAQAQEYERAARLRDEIRSLQQVLHRTYVSAADARDADVLAAVSAGGVSCVMLAMVRGGRHLGDRAHFPHNARECAADEVLLAFMSQHYAVYPAPARVLVDLPVGARFAELAAALAESGVRIVRPRSRMERAWMQMAEHNGLAAIRARDTDAARSAERLERLAHVLGLPEAPRRIECFDVSHTRGEATVASCVVFEGGRAQTAAYRRYNVGGITPGDDYAAMRQAIGRRYERVAAGEGERPDLVLIDGGRGQLSVAVEVLRELGLADLPAIGIAKGEGRKAEFDTLVLPDGRAAPELAADDPALHLAQEIRDEAHRFAITGHRGRRSRSRRTSSLEAIAGIGPERRRRLLAHFGGLAGVLAATPEDLCRVPGIDARLAERIFGGLH